MEHISNLNPKSGDDQKSTTGENSKIADVISTSQCLWTRFTSIVFVWGTFVCGVADPVYL